MVGCWAGGIYVGYANHTGLIPVVRRILNVNYLPGDFGIQLRYYHHRPFAHTLAAVIRILGEDGGIVAVHFIAWILLGYAVNRTMELFELEWISKTPLLIIIALNHSFIGESLEVNRFVGSHCIQPTTVSIAFALLGICSIARQEFKMGGLLFGLSFTYHLQIGAIFAACFLLTNAKTLYSQAGLNVSLWCIGFIVVGAAPGILTFFPLVLSGAAGTTYTLNDMNYYFRDHYQFGGIEKTLICSCGLVAILLFSGSRKSECIPRLLSRFFLVLALGCSLHYFDYYVLHDGRIVQMQFPRISFLFAIFGAISLFSIWERSGKPKMVAAILFSSAIAIICLFPDVNRSAFSPTTWINHYKDDESAWVNVCSWIHDNTDGSARFVSPPGQEGFNYLSERSTVVEFKINPDGGRFLPQWYERLKDVSGGELPSDLGWGGVQQDLNRRYSMLNLNQISQLKQKYGLRMAVVANSALARLDGLDVLYTNTAYSVVSLEKL